MATSTIRIRCAPEKYGFRSGQNPRLAWAWFNNNPVGFNGVPFVLFKTILDLDPNHSNPTLRTIARIWKREAKVPGGGSTWTLDHIGLRPGPSDYVDGVARPPAERRAPLPYGFAFENDRTFAPLTNVETTTLDARLLARRVFQNTTLLIAKLQTADKEENWERDRPGFGSPGTMDRVFFSCAACHVGRVMVGNRMTFLPGMPNTEIEAQYYSKLLMLTSAAFVESGFDPSSATPIDPAGIKPKTAAIRALYTEMLNKARLHPETLYGSSPADVARAKRQALAIAEDFPSVMQDLIAVGVKTHFIYHVVAKNNAYKQALPDIFEDRPGQMDAFGIASGLVAIHTRRKDNSFLEFVRRDNPDSPFYAGFSKANGLPADVPGMTRAGDGPQGGRGSDLQEHFRVGAARARADRHQERQLGDGALSRQLGRQPGCIVADAGVGRVGDRRSAHGERAHPRAAQPVHRQPAAAALSLRQCRPGARRRGQGHLQGQVLRLPRAAEQDDLSGVEARRRSEPDDGQHERVALRPRGARRRSLHASTSSITRGSLAPTGASRRATGRRGSTSTSATRRGACVEGTNGYKADALRGIWAQAPYLHNGSVPTIGQLMCPSTRPARFLRGNLFYDEAMVGFEWAEQPAARYSPFDSILIKEYDTSVPGKANTGHTYGEDLCPDTTGLDPVKDRREIERRILGSKVGALLAYLKTL